MSISTIRVLDFFNSELFEYSNVFSASYDYVSIASGGTANMLLRCHDVTAYIKIAVVSGGTGACRVFEGSTLTGSGTTLHPYNRDRTSDTTVSANASVFEQASLTSYGGSGITLWQGVCPAGERQSLSDNVVSNMPDWILPSGTSYVFSVRNTTGAAQKISLHAMWFEKS